MKKTLSLIMVLLLLVAAWPAAALGAASDKVTLGFSFSIDSDQFTEEVTPTIEAVSKYVGGLKIDFVFAETDDGAQFQIALRHGDKALGALQAVVDEQYINVRGDMLPEGWHAFEIEKLKQMMDESGFEPYAQIDSVTVAMSQLEGATASLESIITAFAQVVSTYLLDNPDCLVLEDVSAESPDHDPAVQSMKMTITDEALLSIFNQSDILLRELAAAGQLADFDGSPISNAVYSQSTIGQLMGTMISTFRQSTIVADVAMLMDENDSPVAIVANERVVDPYDSTDIGFQYFHKTKEDGKLSDYADVVVSTASAGEQAVVVLETLMSDPQDDLQRTDFYLGVTSGEADLGKVEVLGYVEHPNREILDALGISRGVCNVTMDIDSEQLIADVDWQAAHNTLASKQGGPVDVSSALNVSMLIKTEDVGTVTLALGVTVDCLQEETAPAAPDWSKEARSVITDFTDEEMNAFMEKVNASLMMWGFTLLGSMPPEVLQITQAMQ